MSGVWVLVCVYNNTMAAAVVNTCAPLACPTTNPMASSQPCAPLYVCVVCAVGESGGGLSSRSFFNVRVELTEDGNTRVSEVAEVLFKYLDLMGAPGGINEQVG